MASTKPPAGRGDTLDALALRLLSVGLQYPDPPCRARLGALFAEVRRRGALPAPELDALEAAFSAPSPAELEDRHFRLFGPAGDCPLDMAHHLSENPFGQPRRLADLAGFYEAFGVKAGERPDGLPALLELLGLLALKRGLAREKGWQERREIASDASRKLAAVVLPGLARLCSALDPRDPGGFYPRLAAVARRIVADLARGKESLQ